MRFVNSRLNVISTAYVCTASSVELVGSVVVPTLSPTSSFPPNSNSSSKLSSLLMELLTSLLPKLLLTLPLPGLLLLLLVTDDGSLDDVVDAAAAAAADAHPDPVDGVVVVLLHDCILRWRYSLIESFRFGVMGATGSGVVSAGFSRGSELAVLVKIFG